MHGIAFKQNLLKKNEEPETRPQQKGFLELFGIEDTSRSIKTQEAVFGEPETINLLDLFTPPTVENSHAEALLILSSNTHALKNEAPKPPILEVKSKIDQRIITILEPGKPTMQKDGVKTEKLGQNPIQKKFKLGSKGKADISHGIILENRQSIREPVQTLKAEKEGSTQKSASINLVKQEITPFEHDELDGLDAIEDTTKVNVVLPEKTALKQAITLTEQMPTNKLDKTIVDKPADRPNAKIVMDKASQGLKEDVGPQPSATAVETPRVAAINFELNSGPKLEQAPNPEVIIGNATGEVIPVSTYMEVLESAALATPEATRLQQEQESPIRENQVDEKPEVAIQANDLQTAAIPKVEVVNRADQKLEAEASIIQKTSSKTVGVWRVADRSIQIAAEAEPVQIKAVEIVQIGKSEQEDAQVSKLQEKVAEPKAEAIYIERREEDANTIERVDETETAVLEEKALLAPLLYKELEMPRKVELEGIVEQPTQQAPKLEVVKPIVKKIEATKVLDAKSAAPKIQARQKEPTVKLREQLHALNKVLAKEAAVQKQALRAIYKDHEAASVHQVLHALENLKKPTPIRMIVSTAIAENTNLRMGASEAQNQRGSRNSFANKVIQPNVLRKASYALETTMSKQGANNLTAYMADDEDLINSQSQSKIIKLAA